MSEYKGITEEQLKEAVEKVFNDERHKTHFTWYERLNSYQKEEIGKAFKKEVERQLEEMDEERKFDLKDYTKGGINIIPTPPRFENMKEIKKKNKQ